MPYKPTATSAQHALDETQQIAAQKQYSWDEGLSPSLSASTTAIETDLTAGTVVFDGETIPISSRTIPHPDGDPTNPRWDAVCVVDEFGVTEAISGVPAEPVTDTNGTVIRGESAFKPAPSDQVTDEMICLALVWIPANATTNGDLTNQSDGGVAEPVVDRRIHQKGHVTHTTRRGVIDSSGWYRIAGVGTLSPSGTGGRASGLLTIRDTQTGLHSSTTVSASCVYSDHALTVLNSSAFTEPHGAVEGVRIVSGGTNDGGAVDVNVQLGGQSTVDHVEYSIQNNYFPDGWEPMGWEPASVPSGYETSVLDFSTTNMMLGAVGTAGDRNSFTVDHDGLLHTPDVSKNVGFKVTLADHVSVDPNTPTKVPFDRRSYDHRSEFNGALQTPPSTGIVSLDGTYMITAQLGWIPVIPADVETRCSVYVNGTVKLNGYTVGHGKDGRTAVTGPLELVAGDELTVEVEHDAASSLDIVHYNPDTFFSVSRWG